MPGLVDVHAAREMRASREALWAIVADLGRMPDWLAFAGAVADVSGDGASEGATYTVKPHRSYEPDTHWRIAQVEPRRRQVSASEMPMFRGVTSSIELADGADGGVRIEVHWRGEPSKLVSRLMRPFFQRRIQASWDRSLEALEALAAGESAAR